LAANGVCQYIIEVKASCGGMAISLGVMLIMTTLKEDTMLLGAKMVFVIMIIVATLRAYGMLITGSASALVISYLIFELVVAALAIFLHSRVSKV